MDYLRDLFASLSPAGRVILGVAIVVSIVVLYMLGAELGWIPALLGGQ